MKLGFSSKFNSLFISTTLGIMSLTATNNSHAQIRLTDVVTFGADASGSILNQPDVWETRPGGNYDNWLQSLPDGAFLNGPSDSQAQPDITLSPGTNTFRFYGSPGIDNPNFGINLFFDGSASPSISAFGPMLTNVAQVHNFSPDSASPTPQAVPVYNSGIPGAGKLGFISGNQLITLTDFYLAQQTVFGLDEGGQTTLGSDGVLDYVGGFTLVVTTNTSISNCAPPPSGLIGWWQGDGNAIDTIAANNGTMANAGYTNGLVSQAFSFDPQNWPYGTYNAVDVPDSPAYALTNALTIEGWIRPRGNSYVVFWRGDNRPGMDPYALSMQDNNLLDFEITDASGNYQTVETSVPYFKWTHVAATLDGNTGTMSLYTNGVLAAQKSTSVRPFGDLNPSLHPGIGIGNVNDGFNNFPFIGDIDEISLYNRALSSSEIAAIYEAGSAGKCLAEVPVVIAGPLTNSANGHAYLLLSSSSWTDAEAEAEALGGHLATINDAGENAWVQSAFSANGTRALWIGLNDAASEGNFVWSSGETSLYRNWANGEPNNYGGNENYAYIGYPTFSDGTWNDQPDNAVNPLSGADLRGKVYGVVELPTASGGGECLPAPSGLVAWWKGENNAQDAVGGNNGMLLGETDFTPAEAGQGFNFDGTQPSCVHIPYNPNLITSNYTVEAWIDPTARVIGGIGQTLIFGQSYGHVQLVVRTGTTGVRVVFQFGIDHYNFYQVQSTNEIPIGQLTHVAGTWDGTKLQLYINGVLNAVNIPGTHPVNSGCDFFIGGFNSPEIDDCQYVGQFFQGMVDELSYYNRALSQSEIASIYHAGSAGKCFAGIAPIISLQPKSQTVGLNNSASVIVAADGTRPLSYQWRFNNSDILGATNSLLELSNVQLSDAGNYSVVVSNSFGMITSSNALLNILLPRISGLVAYYPFTGSAYDASGNGNDGTVVGATQTTDRLGTTNSTYSFAGVLSPESDIKVQTTQFGLMPGFSFAAWVNYSGGTDNPRIFSTAGWEIATKGTSALRYLDFNNLTSVQLYDCVSSNAFAAGVWHHVVAIRTTNAMSLYIDGELQRTIAAAGNPDYSRNFVPEIGGNSGNSRDVFGGKIDEVCIFNHALSPDEVLALYKTTNTVGYLLSPQILSQPADQNVLSGDPANFSVSATGLEPLAFQWLFNGNPIPDATNSSFKISETQPFMAGAYSVKVSNGIGSITSSNALLTITIPSCTPPPSGLVSWWPAEGSTLDAAGTNSGIFHGTVGFEPGKVGQAFYLSNCFVGVSASPSLNVGAGGGLTFEAWLNPTTLDRQAVAEWNDSSGNIGTHLFITESQYPTLGGGPPGCLYANLVDTSGISHVFSTGGGLITTNTYQHVALTYDKASGIAKLYLNGSAVKTVFLGVFSPQTSYNLYLGTRPSGSFSGAYFKGAIDEPALYNRALSTNEIAAIYAARGTGKCPLPPTIRSVTPPSWYANEGSTVAYTTAATGSPKLTYQWQYAGTDIVGATNSTLTLSNVVYAQAGNYSVVVSNLAGMVSSNVTLRVNRAPAADASATDTLLISPNDTNVIAVLDGSRSSDPDGDSLTYAWFHTGDATPFATTIVAINTLPVGTNQLTLVVSDGMASGSHNFAIEVITTSQAVDRLIALVNAGSTNKQPLVASLEAALASIDRSNPQSAINQLEAFINKVQIQLAPNDPTLAAQLIADAQAIIDALNGGSPVVATTVEISSISHSHSGKSHLKVKGANGHTYVVETSTNMVDWVPAGVAVKTSDGEYDFDDTQTQEIGTRFYRVVSPK